MTDQNPECESAIARNNQQVMSSFKARSFAAIADCYTGDALMLVPQAPPILGRPAIEATFASLREQADELDLVTLGVDLHGDIAFEHGSFSQKGPGGKILGHGKYLVCWKRIGSDWKIHRDVVVGDA